MKKILTLFYFLIVISCTSKHSLTDLDNEQPPSYSFIKIEYFITDDSKTFSSYDIPAIEYSNRSGTKQTYPFDPLDGKYETSSFESNVPEAFAIDSIDLFVPIYIDDHNNITLGNKKWRYTSVTQKQKTTLNFIQNVIVFPNTKAIMNSKLFFKKYKVNYKLLMVDDKTKQEKSVEGIWTGIFPYNAEINISSSNL